tara:strand:- start:253 stop:2193 length:1941 start_codon:yes stop_codon:yes gene_type:complete
MLDKKYFITIILAIKYLILLNYIPLLEDSRYIAFFEQCYEFRNCLNPYTNIQLLEKSYLTFPYSNLMYFVLLPFFYLGKILSVSFINLSYLFFEILMIFTLKKIFNFSLKNLYLILVLNPLFIYSIAILGQLDFIPLSFFIISLYYLKEKNKYSSIIFIVLALSSKIIFVLLLPLIILYFLKLDENIKETSGTIIYTSLLILLFNFQFLIDKNYLDTIFFGINRGYSVVNNSTNIFSNNFLFVLLFITFTLFMYWKNIHRLDFIGVSIFTGFITFPIYITNLSNIGWLLWTFPALLILFFSYEIKIKFLLIAFFLLLVISNEENEFIEINSNFEIIFNYFIYSISTIIIYYLFQIIRKNLYFKIKSSPIIIAIAGDSAVGKSTLANLLEVYFGSKFVDKVELDSFHKYERDDPEWNTKTHLNPEMNDLSSFKKIIINLLNGETQIVKNYNHLTGKFDSNDKKRIKDYLIIEGLHSLFFSDLNKLYDLNVFLDLKEDVKKEVKLVRDKERQKNEEDILNEIKNRRSDYDKYVLPQANKADLYISTLSRDDNLEIELKIDTEYLVDLKRIFATNSVSKTGEIIRDNEISKIKFKINLNSFKEIFYKLTNEIDNLSSMKFVISDDKNLAEQYIKLGLVLFLLNKKIQLR